MQAVLNFGKHEKEPIKKFLSLFPSLETKNEFEELRCRMGASTLTLYHTGKLTIQGRDHAEVKKVLLEGLGLADSMVIGVDETGRGEDSGPFVIASVLGPTNRLRELRDSKKTSDVAAKYDLVTEHSLANLVFSLNSEYVDRLRRKGHTLNDIEAKAVDAMLGFFEALDEKHRIVVDGSPLKVKSKGVEFMVKGDDLEPVVGAASIAAKHVRNLSADKKKRETWQKKEKD
ncbi:MAG: hypothetical protein J4203_08135 [Candidatus Diapherotrites archaeon]|uniref:Ribonuclease n=1 Tax=Candidatus Iainarchaeum sp. TaxID=3101447 RepID=A0A8T4LA30_9ARCH|nr:hypothetical protein [Candidatus Diapherotrites archaeon]